MTPENPTPCDYLAQLITQRAADEPSWTLALDDIAAAFAGSLDAADFYRIAYRTGVAGLKHCDHGSVRELLALLEALGCNDAEENLRAAGVFLNHADHLELTDRFTRAYTRAVVLHTPDLATFTQMLAVLRTYAAAVTAYEETFLNPDAVIRSCVQEWEADTLQQKEHTGRWRRGSTARRRRVTEYIYTLRRREIVGLRTVAPGLLDLLRTMAQQQGYLRRPTEDEPRRQERAGTTGESALDGDQARARAREILGVGAREVSTGEIKRHYRQLMRRFHPDINPDGLEESKRITWAYSVLTG